MKRNKFTDSQIAFILHQAEEGTPVAKVCRKSGISEQTYHRWRKKYGGLMPSKNMAVRRQSGLITVLNLYPKSLICGLTAMV